MPPGDRGDAVRLAAGERIVAFARPGKSRGSRFCRQNVRCRRRAGAVDPRRFATVFKAPWDRQEPGTFSAGSKKWPQPTRSAKRANRCISPGGSPSTAALRRVQCVVHDLSSTGAKITVEDRQRAGGQVAAGVLARREDGTELRSGLASRKIARRQVRQVAARFSIRAAVGSADRHHDIGGAMNCTNPGRLPNCANQRSRCGSFGLLMPSTPNQRRA